MSGHRTGVRLVSYSRARDTSAADLADAFALMLARASRDLSWQDEALCAQVGGDMFFPEKGEPTGPAKRICHICEVRGECLEYALDHEIRHGIWGGHSDRQRRALERNRSAAAA